LEGTFKDHLVQTPLPWAGTSFNQVAQSPDPPGLEHFQGGGIHNFSEQLTSFTVTKELIAL